MCRRTSTLLTILLAALSLSARAGAQLVVAGNQFWSQDSTGISSSAEDGDGFGSELASGDFNGDGFRDLAIGVPDEDLGTVADGGGVHILYGGRAGLATAGTQFWSQDSTNVPDSGEAGDNFGDALAAGDLDCDGFDDLAIGVQEESFSFADSAGTVHVLWGSASGLTPVAGMVGTTPVTTRLDADDFAPTTGRQGGASFGEALAIGIVRSGSVPIGTFLAVGAPGHDPGFADFAGAVFTYTNPCGSRSLETSRYIHQDAEENGVGVAGAAEAGDHFGAALAAGDFDGDGRDDLAVGVPGEDIDSNALVDAGALALFDTASTTGPRFTGNVLIDQSTSGMAGIAREGDQFAEVLASGDFDGDGRDDLAIGIPLDRNSAGDNVGGVVVVLGGSNGLDPTASQAWNATSFSLPLVTGEGFGEALAAGNFDGDTEEDLAIGVPFADVDGVQGAGRVHILYGAFGGLGTNRTQVLDQGAGGLANSPEFRDFLGYALAAGDFDGNGQDDLGIGAAEEAIGSVPQAGAVAAVYGSANGVMGSVRFELASSSVPEAPSPIVGGLALVRLERTGSALLDTSVEVVLDGGTAAEGSDFSFSPITVGWAAGETDSKVVTASTLFDTVEEGDETFTLQLANPSSTHPIASPTLHSVTLLDDDEGGVLAFAGPSFAAFENAGTTTVTVNRTGGEASGVTVQYTLAAGTATPGSDFTLANGTLTFGAGATSKSITVALFDDALAEDYETVLLTLSAAAGGATLGARSTTTLFLRDDDSPRVYRDDFETGGLGRWSARRN